MKQHFWNCRALALLLCFVQIGCSGDASPRSPDPFQETAPDGYRWCFQKMPKNLFLEMTNGMSRQTRVTIETNPCYIEEYSCLTEIEGVEHKFYFDRKGELFSVSWFSDLEYGAVDENLSVPKLQTNPPVRKGSYAPVAWEYGCENVLFEIEFEYQYDNVKWGETTRYYTRNNRLIYYYPGGTTVRYRVRALGKMNKHSPWSDYAYFVMNDRC